MAELNENKVCFIRSVINAIEEFLSLHIIHMLIKPDGVIHHLVGECAMRCCKIAGSCRDRNVVRDLILDGNFTCLFKGRRGCAVYRLIEENVRQLIVPNLGRSLTTGHSIGLCFIAGRCHCFNGRVDGITDTLLVILDSSFIRRIQVVIVRVLQIHRKHSYGILHTSQVHIGVALILIEVKNTRTANELMGPSTIRNGCPSFTSLSRENQVT